MAKVMISVPDDFLTRLDQRAAEAGASRSAFIREALRERLGVPDADEFDAALRRGQRAMEGAGTLDSAKLIRAQRDEHDHRDQRR